MKNIQAAVNFANAADLLVSLTAMCRYANEEHRYPNLIYPSFNVRNVIFLETESSTSGLNRSIGR